MRIAASLLAAAVSALLTSCFTGVESTPRIKAPSGEEARRADPDATFLDDIVAEPADRWAPGKAFAVVDDRFALLLGASAPGRPLAGSVIRYAGKRSVATVTGSQAVEQLFTDDRGDTLVYRAGQRAASPVPFLVELDIVDAGRRRLMSRPLWLVTDVWRDSLGAPLKGRKYIAIRVDSVCPGTADYPLRLCFTASDGASPERGTLLLTPGPAAGHTSRRFESLLTLSDPRLRWRNIDDATWRNIVEGRVVAGMTREQVRLAVGAPSDVDRRAGNGSSGVVFETWVYPSGRLVRFEDGFVVD